MQYHGTCPPISSKQTNDPEGARHQIRCGRARAGWSVQLTSCSLSSRPRNRRVCTIVTHLTLTCLRLSDNMTPSLIALFIRGPRRTFTPLHLRSLRSVLVVLSSDVLRGGRDVYSHPACAPADRVGERRASRHAVYPLGASYRAEPDRRRA